MRTAPLEPSAPGERMISAPKISSSCRRPIEPFSGSTTLSRYPLRRQTSARPMPVLPDDGSRTVCPGRNLPSASALSTMALAMRSFTEPPGFWPSSFTRIRAAGFGLSWVTSIIGVLPMRSSTERAGATRRPRALPAGDGRQDREHVGIGDLGVELVEIPHVFVVAVHVDEFVHRALVGHQLTAQQRKLAHEVLEHLADGRAVGGNRCLTAGVLAQDGREAHFHGHGSMLGDCYRPSSWTGSSRIVPPVMR